MSLRTGKLLSRAKIVKKAFREICRRGFLLSVFSSLLFSCICSVLLSANYISRSFDADGGEVIGKHEVCFIVF